MKADLPFLTFCHILTLCIVASIELNDDNPFRMKRVNAVWRKGQRMLKGQRLSDLYADLVVQDKREGELKRRKGENMDFDGMFEAEVRDEMAMILEKYGLTHHFPSDVYGSRRQGRRRPEHDIKDKKLQKMISKAVKEGFSEDEIHLLKQELGHHQQKMDEYEDLRQEYDELQDKIDNSLENLDGQDEAFTVLNKKRQDMKAKHKEVRESLKTLEGKVKNKPADGDTGQGVEFEDARVYHLWALAQKAGMNEKELASLKTELGHFESRVRKAEYLSDKVKKMDLKFQEGQDVNTKEHESLKEKAQFHNRKVEKYHDDLKSRIQRRIDL
ncbi:alpha-2-macroglobulin receptor-associated protein-like [Mya arenaria]|uniref:alpha-2-macroglobulin receptor-associated protein-like n=1 Tax=Mya arenaria TaxID=6604 RepID=UPI0022E46919|nr:alpha-2-macroglobulin receptor-associated protein-like [Mya arenaria]XP_052775027.1 alpha-2-macroglobulin receptor-associated protein-like [Mya arenaria]